MLRLSKHRGQRPLHTTLRVPQRDSRTYIQKINHENKIFDNNNFDNFCQNNNGAVAKYAYQSRN